MSNETRHSQHPYKHDQSVPPNPLNRLYIMSFTSTDEQWHLMDFLSAVSLECLFINLIMTQQTGLSGISSNWQMSHLLSAIGSTCPLQRVGMSHSPSGMWLMIRNALYSRRTTPWTSHFVMIKNKPVLF